MYKYYGNKQPKADTIEVLEFSVYHKWLELTVSVSAKIEWQPKEPDVGIMSGYWEVVAYTVDTVNYWSEVLNREVPVSSSILDSKAYSKAFESALELAINNIK